VRPARLSSEAVEELFEAAAWYRDQQQGLEFVWRPLLREAGLPYRKPHAMRHSYATWLLEAGADIRWVKDQMGHASIGETEGTYGHLVRERHERDVDHLDAVLWGVNWAGDEGGTLESDDAERPATSHCVPPATGRSLSTDRSGGELLVEGKGFESRRHHRVA